MSIIDWSSDVCSSDLAGRVRIRQAQQNKERQRVVQLRAAGSGRPAGTGASACADPGNRLSLGVRPARRIRGHRIRSGLLGHPPSAVEKAALIFALNSAPADFHRRGKGCYRPAPPDILEAALAGTERKQKKIGKASGREKGWQ